MREQLDWRQSAQGLLERTADLHRIRRQAFSLFARITRVRCGPDRAHLKH